MMPCAASRASFSPDSTSIDDAEHALAALDEVAAVLSVAHGGRRDGLEVLDAQYVRNDIEARQSGQRALDGLAAEAAGRCNRAAEPAQNLFVEDRGRCAHGAFIDDEAHRIRADVDDTDRLHFRGAFVGTREFFPSCQAFAPALAQLAEARRESSL